jgi:type IV secretory pathway VirB2 component (pilin)
MSMAKKMWKMTGRLVDLVTSRQFLTMAGLATPLQTVQQSLTGPVAAGISVVGIAAGGMALVFGGELSEFAKRSCYAVIATAVIVGAGTIMSTLFSSSSAVIG